MFYVLNPVRPKNEALIHISCIIDENDIVYEKTNIPFKTIFHHNI